MTKDIYLNCPQCKINKQATHIKEAMTLRDTPATSFEVVSIGTEGPLRTSNGYRDILAMLCDLTKYTVAYPMKTKDTKTVYKSDNNTELCNQ